MLELITATLVAVNSFWILTLETLSRPAQLFSSDEHGRAGLYPLFLVILAALMVVAVGISKGFADLRRAGKN